LCLSRFLFFCAQRALGFYPAWLHHFIDFQKQ